MRPIRFFASAPVLAAFVLMAPVPKVGAQTENPDVRAPRLKEGRMFTVTVVPAAKELKVFVVGHEQARFKVDDLGFHAFIRSGGKMKPVTSTKRDDHFVIQAQPSSGSELKVKLDFEGKSEEHDIQLK